MLKAFQNTGTISTFFTRPLSCIFMIIGIACVFSPILKAVFAKIKGKKA
jgi:putative tricarboxylic transport membrane protein